MKPKFVLWSLVLLLTFLAGCLATSISTAQDQSSRALPKSPVTSAAKSESKSPVKPPAQPLVKSATKSAAESPLKSLHSQSQSNSHTSSFSSKSIVFPQEAVVLPAAPGRDQFMKSCTVCHSALYVTMQPKHPRKVWTAEVNKMIKVFGAHIDSAEAAQIVDYVVKINGKEDPTSKSAKREKDVEDNNAY